MTAADQAIVFARAQIGKPYVWATSGPDSFDCSGLIFAAYKSAGITLGRTTYQQIFDGTEISRANLLPGDLIFPSIDHVQLYVGGNQVIESPEPGETVHQTAIWGFWRARRVAAPGTAVDAGNVTTSPVGNPLNPSSWPVVGQLNKIAAFLTNKNWIARIGFGAIGLVVVIIGLFVLSSGGTEGLKQRAKTAAKIATVVAK